MKGTSAGTYTDDKGTFKLNVSQKTPYTLVFSSVGFENQEQVVSAGASKVDVSLIIVPYDSKAYTSLFDNSNFESNDTTFKLDSESLNNQLTRSDLIDSTIDRYNALRNSFKDLITSMQKIRFYSKLVYTTID